jgi:hypothetical protein
MLALGGALGPLRHPRQPLVVTPSALLNSTFEPRSHEASVIVIFVIFVVKTSYLVS